MGNRNNKLVKAPIQQSARVQGNDVFVDDGSKAYNIRNCRKEIIGKFVFCPSDMGIVERYNHAIAEFEDIQKTFNERNGEDNEESLKNASDRIKKTIDDLFNADVSGSFFSIASPFTPLENGEFFVANVLESVRAIVEHETGIRLKRAKTRANKYTQKYHR